jgi:transcriptional regulator
MKPIQNTIDEIRKEVLALKTKGMKNKKIAQIMNTKYPENDVTDKDIAEILLEDKTGIRTWRT